MRLVTILAGVYKNMLSMSELLTSTRESDDHVISFDGSLLGCLHAARHSKSI